MKQSTKRLSVLVITLLLLSAAGIERAAAQGLGSGDTAFLNINFGVQPKAREYTVLQTFPLYDETASVSSAVRTSSGGLFDLSGGYRVWGPLALAVGFSRYADTSSSTANAVIPDPLVHDTPHASSLTLDGLEHSERAVHVSVVFVMPLPIEKLDLALSAGPSFFSLSKELPGTGTVAPGATTLQSLGRERRSGSGTGGHFGVDLSYMVTPMIGGGFFMRFASASVDVDDVEGGKVDVGGASYGAGLRLRF